MTISYASEVPNGSAFGCFWRILIKWKGSVYKLIWRELLVYLLVYYIINFTYRYALNEEQQKVFERIRYYFGNSSESIPMSFVLGFYVSLVVKRWWEQYKLLPWPDNLALFISAAIPGNDERGRLMRRNIVRYAVLAYVITLQRISLRVKRRFPTLQHIVDVGLMMESEKKIFEMMNKKANMSKYWMPLVWATNIINRARKEQLITSDHVVQTLLVELSDIRKRLGGLIGYDTVCVPLVYTQVVTLSLYAYFWSALLGRQFVYQHEATTSLTGKYEIPDMYFPFFTALQFCFYVGWLKVAEVLINPFGEDDDDIELNWLIDRHIKAAYMIVDEMHEEHPELLKDQYWDDVVPKDLPYTVASEHYRRDEPKGSAELYKVKESDALYANVAIGSVPGYNGHRGKSGHMQEDVYADYESVDTPVVARKNNWIQRTMRRIGSMRSSSTYGSAGVFNRNRQNSVYSSPEAGQLGNGIPQGQNNTGYKPFYDRLRRKSQQGKHMGRQNTQTKLNSMPMKNRPRIPTPDVSKEIVDRDTKIALSASNAANIGAGVIGIPPQTAYPHGLTNLPDPPILQVVVSGSNVLLPIQEKTEGTPVARTAAAAHLAQAVLPQNIKATFVGSPSIPVTTITMGQLTRLVSGVTTTAALPEVLPAPTPIEHSQITLTEVSSNGSGTEDDTISTSLGMNSLLQDSREDDGYKSNSPVLMEPSKLDCLVNLSVNQHEWNHMIQASEHRAARSEPKGRRSTSLPGPPATLNQGLQPREDRSMSLPHSLGQVPEPPTTGNEVNLPVSATTASESPQALPPTPITTTSTIVTNPRQDDSLNVDKLRSLQPITNATTTHQTRPRSGSFDHTIRRLEHEEVLRKISFNGQPSSPPGKGILTIAPTPLTSSKRNEVYV